MEAEIDNNPPGQSGPIPDEAETLLDGMETGEPEPGTGEAETPPGISPELADAQSRMMIQMICGFAAKHPALADYFTPQIKTQLHGVTVPLVIKYDGAMPEWLTALLDRFKEEIAFAMVGFGISYGAMRAIKEHKAPAQAEPGAAHVNG